MSSINITVLSACMNHPLKTKETLMYQSLMSEAEFETLLLKPPRGCGGSREVYNVKGDELAVIKKVTLKFVGANIIEWLIWKAIENNPRWNNIFGRCFSISGTGRYLMMEKLEDISKVDWSNTPTVPTCLSDVWPNNYGRNLNGVIKIRDYASANFCEYLETDQGHRRAWQVKAPSTL